MGWALKQTEMPLKVIFRKEKGGRENIMKRCGMHASSCHLIPYNFNFAQTSSPEPAKWKPPKAVPSSPVLLLWSVVQSAKQINANPKHINIWAPISMLWILAKSMLYLTPQLVVSTFRKNKKLKNWICTSLIASRKVY